MKIKFDLDDDLPLNKTIEICNVTIAVNAIFYENNKYYPQVFLDECLYKLQKRKKQKIYSAKQKHLLLFYIINNKLKKFCINNI